MKRFGRSGWIPPESVSPAAIERAWSELQRAEHEHEIKIRNKLKDQERLENLAYKFESKVRLILKMSLHLKCVKLTLDLKPFNCSLYYHKAYQD